MSRATISVLLCLVVASAAFVRPAVAYWETDGVAVAAAFQSQLDPRIVSDGSGGAIMVWCDGRNGNDDIYVRRVSASGVPLWTEGGVAVCTEWSTQEYPVIISDGAGGAIIAWHDDRNGAYDIFAQRVSASGMPLWMADGQVICSATSAQMWPAIVSDGEGGAIIMWMDVRSGTRSDIYAQRVNAVGAVLWAWDGVPVCTAANSPGEMALVPDGDGGVIVAWSDYRGGNYDIYAQRLDDQGNALWWPDGVALCTASNHQRYPVIASDGAGGAIVTWDDARAGHRDIYAQRVNTNGVVQWTVNGAAFCATSGEQVYPVIVADGAGGAIAAWTDGRGAPYYDIYAQRTNSLGVAQWTVNGVVLCGATRNQSYVQLASDGAGGAIAAWLDSRNWYYDIYAQAVNPSGAVLWVMDGVPVCTAGGHQYDAQVVSDGAGGIIAGWRDRRIGSDLTYCQLVDRHGRPGYLAPDIYSVRDVPGDQGGRVYLSWYAARGDRFKTADVSYYSIWRAIAPGAVSLALDGGARLIGTPADLDPSGARPVVRVEKIGAVEYFWELVDSQGAYYRPSYGKPVATLFDSTGACDEYHYLQVVAHSPDPFVFWESAIDSGRSVDNLAPEAPVGLAGEQRYAPAGLELSWRANVESDLDGYAIYRGTSVGFEPGPENLVASTPDTIYLDGSWSWEGGYYYKVAALDIHGNQSGFALLAPDGVTGEETPKVPAASYLAQNFPNPFNPTTRIAFGLAAPARVSLRIYDAAGRLVRELVNEARLAARYEEIWDGRDGAARQAASGIYFYRLDAGSFTQTKKMILLR